MKIKLIALTLTGVLLATGGIISHLGRIRERIAPQEISSQDELVSKSPTAPISTDREKQLDSSEARVKGKSTEAASGTSTEITPIPTPQQQILTSLPTTLPIPTTNTSTSILPTPTPCVCIEAWGAGGFIGLCRGRSNCTIKYSCLLSDQQRYGVWNDEQTVCLEEYVRKRGEWPTFSNYTLAVSTGGQRVVLPPSAATGNSCSPAKAEIDDDRNSKIQREDSRYSRELESIGDDYASRGLYDSGARQRSQGLAGINHQNKLQEIENDYQRQLTNLKGSGCRL